MAFASVVRGVAVFGMTAMLALPAFAQQFPSRPIKVIVAFGAGGTADTVIRLYGQKMSELLNTPVVVENKPGAHQLPAIRALQTSAPDGYTLYAATGSSLVQNPALRKNLPYDPLKDFSLIGIAVTNPAVIFIGSELPARTIGELVTYAAANPGKLNYGSAGVGTAGHLAVEALLAITGMKMTHIPYKSDAEVIREVMAGNVHMGIMTTLNTVSFVNSGKIRGLAVTTAQRLPYLPNVPSLTETGIKELSTLEPHTFISFVGPAGVPAPVVKQLNEAINKVSGMPDVVTRVRDNLFAEPATTTPASFREFIVDQRERWSVIGRTVTLPE